ncbi:MAG: adenylate kinase [Bacteroidales bacterium]|nr:adenylate kinase [Bacteroidales bacterium]
MLNIVIFGAPGAGKGTQADLLAEKYDLLHISTGDLLRQEVAKGSPLGQRAQAIMNRGDLVGDDIVVQLLAQALRGVAGGEGQEPSEYRGCIVDGFPRTVAQAQTLEFLFSKLRLSIDAIIAIDVPRDELVRRIHERAAISGRADDTEEVIRHRIELYDEQTRPVLDYYRVSGRLVTVDGSEQIADTNTRICKVMDVLLRGGKR